jgi:hypothetical protein
LVILLAKFQTSNHSIPNTKYFLPKLLRSHPLKDQKKGQMRALGWLVPLVVPGESYLDRIVDPGGRLCAHKQTLAKVSKEHQKPSLTLTEHVLTRKPTQLTLSCNIKRIPYE